ncbi:MAG: hypothetical protein EVB11_10470 [Winogradskyella sp.]|nr:MAG: hypothetical protein EVB11_10470 [Winogradskyella sp.]
MALVFAVLMPTLVKFAHGFQNHEHEVCYDASSSHFHELDIDCDFCKFKLNTQYSHEFEYPPTTLTTELSVKKINSQYNFISDYQQLQFSLRGPPSLI